MRLLANMEEMNIPFQHTGLVTTRAQLAKSPDVSRRVVKSFVEGIHLAMTNAEVSKQAFRRYIRLQQDREQEESLAGPAQFPAAQTLPVDRRIQSRLRRTRRANPRGKNRRPQRLHRHEIFGRARPQRLHRRTVSVGGRSFTAKEAARQTHNPKSHRDCTTEARSSQSAECIFIKYSASSAFLRCVLRTSCPRIAGKSHSFDAVRRLTTFYGFCHFDFPWVCVST